MPRDILVCTVGTSLLDQVQQLEPSDPLRVSSERNKAQDVAQALLELDPLSSACGAEINSVASIISTGSLAEQALIELLVPDTAQGRNVGRYLELYFRNQRCPIRFKEVQVQVVEELNDSNPKRFRTMGLRELVRRIADVIQRYGAQRVAINATGGYKAQICLAGLVGQALEVPVYYMFERFTEVVELRPQPVSLEFGLWLDNFELFRFLGRRHDADPEELIRNLGGQPDERLEPLLDRAENQRVALSPVGELFHRQFMYRFHLARERLLPAATTGERRQHPGQDRLLLDNSHLNQVKPNGLFTYLSRVFDETPYIRGFHCYYADPDLSEETRFRVGDVDNCQGLELVYSDGTRTARLEVELDTTDLDHAKAAVADLNQRFARDEKGLWKFETGGVPFAGFSEVVSRQ